MGGGEAANATEGSKTFGTGRNESVVMQIFNWRGLISAFQTITAIPVPGQGAENAEDSLSWFPWVGAVLGIAAWAVAYLAMQAPIEAQLRVFWILIAAAIIVTVWAVLTRGFHLDGLADMCDGFGGGWTKERVLEIMRDSRIGSFGVIALSLGLLLKTLAVAMVLGSGSWQALLIVPILARSAMVCQASFNKYARRDTVKVSMANHFIDKACASHFGGACLHTLLLLGLLYLAVPFSWVAAAEIILAVYLSMLTVGYISRSKIGGITGDILGATCEIAEDVGLIAAALCV